MSRLRRLDRAILSESADAPIDSDDQEQLIAHLVEQSESSFRISVRVLVATVLVEIPVSVFALRLSMRGARAVVLLLVCHLLTLVNCLYEFQQPASATYPGNSTWNSHDRYVKWASAVGKALFSFYGVLALNAIVLFQLLRQVYVSHGFRIIDTLLLLPVVNLAAVTLIRKWHGDVKSEIYGLHGLKYKFKTA